MLYFDEEGNANINQMWINVRCFNLSMISPVQWLCIATGVILILVIILLIKHGNEWFRPKAPRGYHRVN